MRSGTLRYRVLIEQLVAGSPQQKPTGELDETWATVGTVWADVRNIDGAEQFNSDKIDSKLNTEIELRTVTARRLAVVAGMRCVFRSTYYNIGAVVERPLKDSTILRCSSGVNQG